MIDSIKFISEQKSATIEINQDGCKEIINEIEKLNNVIEDLKAILKSKGYETYIPVLEGNDKE